MYSRFLLAIPLTALLMLGSCTKHYSLGPMVWTPTPTPTVPSSATATSTIFLTATSTSTATVPPPTATSTLTVTATQTPLGNCVMVDDFNDGNLTDSFGLNWITTAFGSGTVNGPTLDNSSNAYSGTSLEWSGTSPSMNGMDGFACMAQLGGSDLSPYFNGLSFYIKTSAPSTLQVQLVSGVVSTSSAVYNYTFATTTQWMLVTVPLSSWTTEWGLPSVPLATGLTDVMSFQWLFDTNVATTPIQVSLDDVCITTNSGGPTPTATP